MFRMLDEDSSGNITPEECVEGMLKLNLGIPRAYLEHLVNVIDSDRDGEINYAEFAKLITCDDIVKIKVDGAEEEGLIQKAIDRNYYKDTGILKSEITAARVSAREYGRRNCVDFAHVAMSLLRCRSAPPTACCRLWACRLVRQLTCITGPMPSSVLRR